MEDDFVARRWPNGVTCPRCGSGNVLFMEKYNRWHCREKHDAPQFTLKTGTLIASPGREDAVSDFHFIIGLRERPKRSNEHWITTREDDVRVPAARGRVLCILPLNDRKDIRIPIRAGPLRRNAHAK